MHSSSEAKVFKVGNRKMVGFFVLLGVFIGFSIASMMMMPEFNIMEYKELFIPLGTALSLLSAPFFAANVAAKFTGKKNDIEQVP